MALFSFAPKLLQVSYSREDVYQKFGLIERNIHSYFLLNGIRNESRDCRVFQHIELPYKGALIPDVEINLYNPYYFENATATCPTIPGCIAQGKGNENALLNLYVAMAESLLLRDELSIRLVDYSFEIDDRFDELPLNQFQSDTSEVIKKNIAKLGYNKIYSGYFNYLCINRDNPLLVLTLPRYFYDYEKHGNGIVPINYIDITGRVNTLTEFLISGMQ